MNSLALQKVRRNSEFRPLTDPEQSIQLRIIANGSGATQGVVPKMRIVSLLFIWALPFLPAGGHGQSGCPEFVPASQADSHTSSVAMQRAGDESLPGDPITGNLGRSLADDDDSLEDGSLDLSFSTFWRSQAVKRGNLTSLAPLQHNLLRIPPCPHPLRC
jgi:hypothetical protein